MEITGNVTITAVMAVIAAFITQAVKQAIPSAWHRYIPLPLAAVCIGAGVLLAWLQSQDMVQGGIMGFMAAALAVYGYEFVTEVIKRPSD
jgi:hypothetical protein